MQEVHVHHDPMKPASELVLRRITRREARFRDWVLEWDHRYGLDDILSPLTVTQREQFANDLESTLPVE